MGLVLFSAVVGTVLIHGQPVPDARITREYRWSWKQQTGLDHATTNAQGMFRLPEIAGRSLSARWLPHEPNVRQTLRIEHGGRTYAAWMFDKPCYERDGELGRPIVLTCHLDAEPRHHEGVYGLCTFD